MMLISFGIIIGMWLERFQIVIISLSHTKMPSSWGYFAGTFWDWSLLFGTVGLFFTGFLLAIRVVPVISMHEVAELMKKKQS